MKKREEQKEGKIPSAKSVARNRAGGPSVVMRVPEKMEEMILSFIDVLADYNNQEEFGETKILPPSKTTDIQRQKLCCVMEKMIGFEKERQLKIHHQLSDSYHYNLSESENNTVSDSTSTYIRSNKRNDDTGSNHNYHLLITTNRQYDYTRFIRSSCCTYWTKLSTNIQIGDIVYMLIQTDNGNVLVKTLAKEICVIMDPNRIFYKKVCKRSEQAYKLEYVGHYYGEKNTYETFENHGLSKYSVHRILSDEQVIWLEGLIDTFNNKLVQ